LKKKGILVPSTDPFIFNFHGNKKKFEQFMVVKDEIKI